ncbi:MAG: GNAT family N-acetyltransferase [Sphingomonadales bacterium]|nr:GNAT family N-acetyltransferase [Sphingomonadales bacterium]
MEHNENSTSGQRRLSLRLAQDERDLIAVQRLRWQVFYAELGAGATNAPPESLDCDAYDPLCDHLLVIDEDAPAGERVVGTYRLLRESVAARSIGFYSAGEFDLEVLARRGHGGGQAGELLELGRSCVLPPYRNSGTISLLWRGIADYIARYDISLLFGCASFAGTDPDAHAAALSYLYHKHLAPAEMRPVVLEGKGIALERLPAGSYDERRAIFGLPPLVKGYMRVGAKFGEGAYVDRAFNTIDLCVVMPVELIADRYAARFSAAA